MLAGVKEEGGAGELGAEIVAQQPHVFGRVALAGLERDEDFAVGVRDGRVGAEGEVDAAVGQADVVEDELGFVRRDDGADVALDGGEVLLGILQAQTHGRVDMQAHLAGIDVGEEVLADEKE